MINRTYEYIKRVTQGYFKSRIGTNHGTREHQYYSHFTGKVWFESY